MTTCPCGSGREYDECCRPIIEGTIKAPTAEALMRARYTAHTVKNFDFIEKSLVPSLRGSDDKEAMNRWADSVQWDGLEITDTKDGGESDEKGEVTFVAKYSFQNVPQILHERAHFTKVEGEWLYEDGDDLSHETVHREAPKVGRNDPCPCGSGKKYKKCCGKNA